MNPADTLQDEIRVINEIEQSVTHIEKQIRKTINADENMAAEVEKVREECEAFCQEVAARKKKLTVWRASMQNEADAIDRRLNKNDKLTTGTSIASSMANIQQKLAQTLVDNIFTKLEKRRKAAEARHEEIDKLEIKNRNEREERQIEYEQKMKKVAKLSEAYDIYEEMFVDVQFGIGQIDALKKEIIDLDFQIAKAKRLNAICEVNDQKINEENERLEPIKHDLEGRENTANEWEQKINAERERVEQYQSDIENSEKMSLQREKDTEALEEEAKQLQSRLNNLVTQVDNQFEVFTAEQATTAKASAATA
ncbi:hypothetical protein TRFO_21487 [Tritrichomonas foetus]|uniref:Uncharacterized protein n=1 Tax=Tritrichomonas foetus TaxID=1144522 RepID=A0A1J4KJR4_9EUKA|nr:hypothetical protein TRFO_21487 [Tritrichomonas foetus]|eukprot:OHT09597.1 hypothetical protein TRFO_21487 [Tritrichomonas foetus]